MACRSLPQTSKRCAPIWTACELLPLLSSRRLLRQQQRQQLQLHAHHHQVHHRLSSQRLSELHWCHAAELVSAPTLRGEETLSQRKNFRVSGVIERKLLLRRAQTRVIAASAASVQVCSQHVQQHSWRPKCSLGKVLLRNRQQVMSKGVSQPADAGLRHISHTLCAKVQGWCCRALKQTCTPSETVS